MRVFFLVKVFVHILQHVFHTNLFGVSHRPYGVELQSLGHGTLKDEYRRGTRTGNKVNTLWMQLWNGLAKNTVMPCVHVADAIGADERRAITVHRFQNTVFEHCTLVRLLTEAGRKNDKRPHLLLGCQHFHDIGTHRCRNSQNGQVGFGNVLHIGISLHALYFLFFRIDSTQFTGISATDKIAQDGPSGLMHIVGCSHHNNAGRMKQLGCYHSLSTFSLR